MKKIIISLLLLIVSTFSFASEFKYYKCNHVELCVKKLNELSEEYKIISYKIIKPAYGSTHEWFMVIEVEKKEYIIGG